MTRACNEFTGSVVIGAMTTRPEPLFRIRITDAGTVEIEPGASFDPDVHADLMVKAHRAALSSVAGVMCAPAR